MYKHLTLILPLLLLALPVHAASSDREQPLNIEADSLTVNDLTKVGTYTGNVVATQGSMMLLADKLVVTQSANGLKTVTAYGNPVKFREKEQNSDQYVEAYGAQAHYDEASSELTLTGNAFLRRGGDQVQGNIVTYNTRTEFFKVVGAPNNPSGRVRMVIMPRKQGGAAAAPAQKP